MRENRKKARYLKGAPNYLTSRRARSYLKVILDCLKMWFILAMVIAMKRSAL